MAWSISSWFPAWGDAGSQPSSGKNYQGGDQVNEKHFDYLWNSLYNFEDEVRSALQDIDSDQDGVVDQADDSNALEGNTTSQVRNHSPNAHASSHKDGGSDELDAAELAGALGTSGQVLQTDGSAASWVSTTDTTTDVSDDGTTIINDTTDINLTHYLTATDDGDGSATVDAEATTVHSEGYAPGLFG